MLEYEKKERKYVKADVNTKSNQLKYGSTTKTCSQLGIGTKTETKKKEDYERSR